MNVDDRIHLVHEVPDKGRAKSFCGAILRKGKWFDTPESVWKQATNDHTKTVWTKRLKSNKLEFYSRNKPYLGNICPNCARSPDYELAILANVP